MAQSWSRKGGRNSWGERFFKYSWELRPLYSASLPANFTQSSVVAPLKVFVTFYGHHFHNVHRYRNYRHYRVAVKIGRND